MKKNTKNPKSPLLEKIIRGHLYALIILIPLIFWFDTQTIFTIPKLLALRTFSISAGLFILIKFALTRQFDFRLPFRSAFLGFWALSLIISTIFTINRYTSLFGQYSRFMGLVTMLNFLLIPIFIANFFRKEDFQKILNLSTLTAILAAFYGLMQYFDFFGLWKLDFVWTESPQIRVFGTMGHANHLGAYLSAHLALLLAQTKFFHPLQKIFWKNWLLTLSKIAAAILMFAVLILTASRGALLAFFLAIALVVALKLWKHRQEASKTTKKILTSIALIFTVLFLIPQIFPDSFRELSLIRRSEQTIQSIQKGYLPERLSFLFSSAQMFLAHPCTGTGLSTFRDAYSAFRRADYLIDGIGNAQYITVPESSHNQYADVLSTQGLLGIVTYLALLATTLHLLLSQFKKARPDRENYHLALFAALSVLLLQNLFNYNEIGNSFLFYLLIGLILSENTAPVSKKPFYSPTWLAYLPLAIGTMLLTWTFLSTVIQPARADFYYRLARLSKSHHDTELSSHYFQLATASQNSEYQIWQEYGDSNIQSAIDESNNAEFHLRQAIQHYLQAIQLNDHYASTFFNLAESYLSLSRLTKDRQYSTISQNYYLLAIQKSPNNPRYLYEYARKLHSDWNNPTDSIKLLQQALQIAPNYREPQDYLNFLYKNHPKLRN